MRRLIVLAMLAAASTHSAESDSIEAGPLTISLHTSETATVFHIVDQLAAWSPYCHAQYAAHFTDLTDNQHKLLAEHAALRAEKSWGAGLEQTFYTELSLDEAIEEGIRAGHLSAEQADVERRILEAFVPLAQQLTLERRDSVDEFIEEIRQQYDALTDVAQKAARLCVVEAVEAPVYLIPNPDDASFGGGYNGGRLTIEVSPHPELFNIFLHEVMHVFLVARQDAIEAAAATSDGLDAETLGEGIAYALSPGMLHTQGPDADPLRDRVAQDWQAASPLSEPYTRFNRYALALRPIMMDAIERDATTFESFLERAVDVWRAVQSLSEAAGHGTTKWTGKHSSGPSVLMLAPQRCGDIFSALSGRLQGQSVNTWGRGHRPEYYDELYRLHAKPGDRVLLLFALDQPDRTPEELQFLLPKPWADLEATATKDGAAIATHDVEDIHVTVAVAPNCAALETLLQDPELDVLPDL